MPGGSNSMKRHPEGGLGRSRAAFGLPLGSRSVKWRTLHSESVDTLPSWGRFSHHIRDHGNSNGDPSGQTAYTTDIKLEKRSPGGTEKKTRSLIEKESQIKRPWEAKTELSRDAYFKINVFSGSRHLLTN